MNILSNIEFKHLTDLSDKASSRLKLVARRRYESDPNGLVGSKDLQTLISIFQGSPDARWLQSLDYLHRSGKLTGVVAGKQKWEMHLAEVESLHRRGEVAFRLGDHVFLKESGRYGIVLDYFPEDKKYLISFDPYQIEFHDKKDLEKTAVKKRKDESNR